MKKYVVKDFFNGKVKWCYYDGIFLVSPQFLDEFKALHTDIVEVFA